MCAEIPICGLGQRDIGDRSVHIIETWLLSVLIIGVFDGGTEGRHVGCQVVGIVYDEDYREVQVTDFHDKPVGLVSLN